MLDSRFFCIKKILYFLLFSASSSPYCLNGAVLSVETSASTAFLINAENGNVLFAKNAEEPLYPASTTKIATAMYAIFLKSSSLDQIVTISYDSVASVPIAVRRSGKHPSYRLEFGGTHMGLKVGEQMSLRTLLYGLMLLSGNDAANMIAETVSGSIPQFMEELNVFLHKIGCSNTQFKNPHGLPDSEHITTAKDLARMAQVAMTNSTFKEIVSSTKYLRPQTSKQPETPMVQRNALLKPGNKHYYPYATGVKTGYTIQAGHTIVSSAKKDDRSLIAVVCHKEGSDQRYRSVIQLFEMAFQEVKKNRTLFSAAHDLFQQKVDGAKEIVKAVLAEDLVVSFYPSEEKKFYSQIQWKKLSLPIEKGEFVGEVMIFDDREILERSMPLFAQKAVEPTLGYQIEQIKIQALKQVQKYRNYIGYLTAAGLLIGALVKVMKRKKKESHKA